MFALAPCLMLATGAQLGELRRESDATRELRLRAQVERASGWRLSESEHFLVVSQLDDRRLELELAARADGLRDLLRTTFPPDGVRGSPPLAASSPAPTRARSVIHVYVSREAFWAAGGPAGTVGWWNTEDASIRLYATLEGAGKRALYRNLQSLIVAEYFDVEFDAAPLEPWFLYGLQAVVAGYELKNGKWRPEPDLEFVRAAKEIVSAQQFVPLAEFVALDAPAYFGVGRHGTDFADHWAEGGALMWFLLQGAESRGFEQRWGRIPERFFDEWRSSRDPALAHAFAFDGIDFERLEAAWRRFVPRIR